MCLWINSIAAHIISALIYFKKIVCFFVLGIYLAHKSQEQNCPGRPAHWSLKDTKSRTEIFRKRQLNWSLSTNFGSYTTNLWECQQIMMGTGAGRKNLKKNLLKPRTWNYSKDYYCQATGQKQWCSVEHHRDASIWATCKPNMRKLTYFVFLQNCFPPLMQQWTGLGKKCSTLHWLQQVFQGCLM